MLDIHVNHVMRILHLLQEEEDISNIFMKPQMLVLCLNKALGKIIKLRETPKAFSTKFIVKAINGQVNSLVYGKKEK